VEIPFTVEQFFDVFGTYNTAIWPVQILEYILGIVVLVLAFGGSKLAAPIVSRILGFFWIWMGVFYHIVHFSVINPAAWIFGIFFILQGLLFLLFARPAFRFILKPLPVTGGASFFMRCLFTPFWVSVSAILTPKLQCLALLRAQRRSSLLEYCSGQKNRCLPIYLSFLCFGLLLA